MKIVYRYSLLFAEPEASKSCVDLNRLGNDNVLRQPVIDCLDKIFGWYRRIDKEVCDLAEGADTCIGSAGTVYFDENAGQFTECSFEFALDGSFAPLVLPAAVV